MNYDSWKTTAPDDRIPRPARLGDTVASVTLVEACERALCADADDEERATAREHIRSYLAGRAAHPAAKPRSGR